MSPRIWPGCVTKLLPIASGCSARRSSPKRWAPTTTTASASRVSLWPSAPSPRRRTTARRNATTAGRSTSTRRPRSGPELGQLDPVDRDRLAGAVARVTVDLGDRVDDVHPRGHTPEDGVLAVQPGRRLRRDDEELAAVRV